jgi:hypothetical protein
MIAQQDLASEPDIQEASDVLLAGFLQSSAAAVSAAAPLRGGAEVGVTFTDVAGDWRFHVSDGRPLLERGRPVDPDFDLRLAPGAVRALCSRADANIVDLGITFFEHIVSREPERQIRVTLHGGLVTLAKHGWLGVLARGGPALVRWMAQKGLEGPGAIAGALTKLKTLRK